MDLERFLDLATSSWLQFSLETICLTLSKCPDLLIEYISSPQRQLIACSAVVPHLFVLPLGRVPSDDVPGSVSKQQPKFMYSTNLKNTGNDNSNNGCRTVTRWCRTVVVTSLIQMWHAF